MSGIESAAGLGARDWTNLKASALVVGSVGIFALIFTSGRFAGDLASPLQIMFLRYVGGFVTVLIVAAASGESWRSIQSPNRLSQVMRALTGGLGGAALIFGNAQMPLVDANAISLLRAVFIVALGMIVLGERLRAGHIAGAVVCLAGAAVVMASRGAFSEAHAGYLLPAMVVLAGAVLLGFEGLFIKMLAMSDRPIVTLAHVNLFGMLLLLVPAALTWQSFGPVNFAFLALGPLAILGQYLNIRGHALASVSLLAPLGYASLIFATLFGWLFFAELPTPGVAMGAALIAIGGVVLSVSRR